MIYLSFLHIFSNQMVFLLVFCCFPYHYYPLIIYWLEIPLKKIYNLGHCFPLFLSITTCITQKFFNICVICISKRVFLIIGTVSIVPFSHLFLLYYIDNVFIFVSFGTVFIVPFSHLLYYIDNAFISMLFGTVSNVPSIAICINVSLVLLYKLHCILSEKGILVLRERMKVKIFRILFMTLRFVVWFSHIEWLMLLYIVV